MYYLKSPRLLKFILVLFILVSSGVLQAAAFAQSTKEEAKEEESLYVAKKAYEDGFYDVSLGLLERFLKSYPDSSKVWEAQLLTGQCYFHQDRFMDALSKFESILDKPGAKAIKDEITYWIAEVHFRGNSFSQAQSYYRKIIEGFPNSPYVPSAYYSLGWCLFQEREYQKALAYFKGVEEKYPREPQAKDASFKIIECLYNMKDYTGLKDRIKPYFKAYAKDPTRTGYLYFYLAEADYYLNNFSDAALNYSKVIQNSDDVKTCALSELGMGWSYLKLKRYQEAQGVLSDIKREDLDPHSADILLLARGMLFTETDNAQEAKKAYDQLLNSSADPLVLVQAYIGKADAIYNMADYAEAINVYKEALGKEWFKDVPQEISDKLYYSLAWAYLKSGEFKEAINEFQKIVNTSSDNIVKVSALCQIGDAYQDSGEYAKAQGAYDTVLKDYSDSMYADYVQYQLGLTQLKSSNYDGAVLSFAALKKNFPASKLLDDAAYGLALAYFQKQDYGASQEALAQFKDGFKDSAVRPQAMYLLGASLYNLERFQDSISVFKDIINAYNQDKELVQKAEYEIADCFYKMGEEKEAMERFNALRTKYPDSTLTPEVMWWLGEYYYRHSDPVLSRRYFLSLVQDFPKSDLVADAYYILGSGYADEAKYEEAIQSFNKAMDLGKSDLKGQAAIAIADIYVKQGSPDSALKVYKDTVTAYSHLNSVVYPKIAELLYKMADYAGSLDYYRKSLDVVPVKDMAAIQFKVAEVLEAEGNADEALGEYLKASYLYSDTSSVAVKALLRVAKVYEDKENFKEAGSIYKKVIDLNTEESKYAKERLDWIKTHVR